MINPRKIFITAIMLVLLSMCGCSRSDEPYVYYLNYKPEADAAWQELAAKYTEETGIKVRIVTAASGTYHDTLSAQLNKSTCPTFFNCSNIQGLENMGDYPLDLNGTDLASRLKTRDFCLQGDNGELYGIGFCYEAYGLITNKALLREAGYDVCDINNFEQLKTAAQDIHARREDLGFDAFTSSGLDSSSSWRFSGHLANMPLYCEFEKNGIVTQPAEITGEYLGLYKNIWDLYINNSSIAGNELSSATGNRAEDEFGSGRAVFFQNGTWEYSVLTDPDKYGMSPDDLSMLPIYCGAQDEENFGLCCGTENYWVINSKADQESIEATLDFLDWVVTSEDGKKMLAVQFGVTPFKNALPTDNVFFLDEQRYEEAGRHPITWEFSKTPNVDVWRNGVTSALTDYSAGTGTWEDVESAFINGWKYQYRLEHGIM